MSSAAVVSRALRVKNHLLSHFCRFLLFSRKLWVSRNHWSGKQQRLSPDGNVNVFNSLQFMNSLRTVFVPLNATGMLRFTNGEGCALIICLGEATLLFLPPFSVGVNS